MPDRDSDLYSIPVTTIDGRATTLAEYRGKVMLIVNVASQCSLTPQYAGLETLYRTYRDRGFVVLGFPCNQFFHEEPEAEPEIQKFCTTKYSVTFPMFAKIDVNGKNAHPLYRFLKSRHRGLMGTRFILWNFTKFLISRTGEVVGRYGPIAKPEKLAKWIEKELGFGEPGQL